MSKFVYPIFLAFAAAIGARADGNHAGGPDDALVGTLPVVEAASLHTQTLEEAPANVTIVTAEDIRKYGYRTLNEALSAVRGLFSSSDGVFNYIGMRGFSVVGDFNTRFLVLLNGHPLTDNVFNSNGVFGQDFGLDMDLISRIEIVRGPTSALYGSNGILATINVVTKSPVDMEGVRVSTETGSYGEKKAIVSASVDLGHGANLLISASVFNNTGPAMRFPGVGTLAGLDGERGYHTFANLVWHNWSFTAYFNDRVTQMPVSWPGTVPFQRGPQLGDARDLLLANYSRAAGPGKLQWQVYYDRSRVEERLYFPLDSAGGIEDIRFRVRGDSVGSQFIYQIPLKSIGELSIGGQVNGDLQSEQQSSIASPGTFDLPVISHPDLSAALFVQQEWKIGSRLTLYGGLRLDGSRNFGAALSPRLALVYQVSPKTTYKLVYGRPFRNPSNCEQYLTGLEGTVQNLNLRAETANTVEISAERKILPNLSLIANVYDYRLKNLIEAVILSPSAEQYQNTTGIESKGLEVEVNGKTVAGVEGTASYSYELASRSDGAYIANLPRHIGKFRAAVPLAGSRFWFSAALQYTSSRLTAWENPLRPVALADCTVSTNRLHPNFDIQAGIRNLAGWKYSDPTGFALDQMPANGRTFFVKLTYHTRE